MSEIILLSDVRLSFPHIAEPQKNVNEQTGATRVSYNCEFIMPKDHPGFAAFMKRLTLTQAVCSTLVASYPVKWHLAGPAFADSRP